MCEILICYRGAVVLLRSWVSWRALVAPNGGEIRLSAPHLSRRDLLAGAAGIAFARLPGPLPLHEGGKPISFLFWRTI
jgi:hypothetical protein